MGVYLGQLPPAEVARLKAELAETIIANFCYPRFFDYRTESLRMRPVNRAKRQEVWLYLSSVDFTAWSRIDLMSPDFQRHIERLFIQFVQRNRSFFGDQGRKRMPDIRVLITSCSTSVVQGLRNHIMGQRQERQGIPPFGSPRAAIPWSTPASSNRYEIGWEQIAAATMLLQQQLHEARLQAKSALPGELRPTQTIDASSSSPERSASSPIEQNGLATLQGQQVASPGSRSAALENRPTPPKTAPLQESRSTSPLNPASLPNSVPVHTMAPAATVMPSIATASAPVRKQEAVPTSIAPDTPRMGPTVVSTPIPIKSVEPIGTSGTTQQAQISASAPIVSPLPPASPVSPMPTVVSRSLPQSTTPSSSVTLPPTAAERRESRENTLMLVGEDDIAIFEQMRHQLIIWLRVEAVHSGLEVAGQGPPQLLEMLRRQDHFDETRLQVVSTLLNLSNQVIKNGKVSVLDYKQALMFHLMHTRR